MQHHFQDLLHVCWKSELGKSSQAEHNGCGHSEGGIVRAVGKAKLLGVLFQTLLSLMVVLLFLSTLMGSS